MQTDLSKRLARWREAWQSLDTKRIAAIYADNAVHVSQSVSRVFPENVEGRLQGRKPIAEWAKAIAARLKALHFEPLHVTETKDASIFEYWRTLNNDKTTAVRVCEVISWRGDEVIESRVYHA
jgi:ketosteroid isomerase-like protein